MAWTGGDGILWHNPANWVEVGTTPPVHRVPGAGDDVSIGAGAQIYADGDVTIRSGLVEGGGRLQFGRNLTVSAGLANAGTIEFGGRSGQRLEVTAGTFLNTGNLIYDGGDYNSYVAARLDNRGTITAIDGYLKINIKGDSETGPQLEDPAYTFTNTGSIVLSNGTHCYVGGIPNPDSLGMSEGVGVIGIQMVDWDLDGDWTVPATSVPLWLQKSSIAGAGTITISNGATLGLDGSIIDAHVVNHGILFGLRASTINGQLELPADSVLAVGFDVLPFPSQYPENEHFDPPVPLALTVTKGFTNYGKISLFDTSLGSTLNVTGGTLVNADGGVISSSVGYDSLSKGNSLNANLDNQGTISVRGASLTISNGFSNYGTVELSPTQRKWNELRVTEGTLVNTRQGTIAFQGGETNSGGTIAAQVDNAGIIRVRGRHLSVNPDWATTHNSAWTFTNTGEVYTDSAALFSVGGKFNPTQGIIDGAGALLLEGAAVELDADWSPVIPVWIVRNSTVVGPGKLSILAGNGVGLADATINAAVDNRGLLAATGLAKLSEPTPFTPVSSLINGPLTMTAGSKLLVGYAPEGWANTAHPWVDDMLVSIMQWDGKGPTDASLTIANGFVNQGHIGLSAVDDRNMLSVANGILVNSSDGTIIASRDVGSQGNGNLLNAQLNNQGTIRVVDANLAINLQPAGSAFGLTNEAVGTIDVAAGQTLTVGGTAVVNQGVIRLQGNAVVDFAVPVVTIDEQGTVQGEPAGTMHVRGSLLGNTQNVASHTLPGTVWLDGAGTDAVPQLLEVMQADRGDIDDGYAANPSYGALKLGANTYVKLVDQARNSPSTSAEAAYADSLAVPTGTTLDRNKLRLYARQASIAGDDRGVPSAWHNYANPCDVDGDGVVTSLDVLLIITHINAHPGSAAPPGSPSSPPRYYDVTAGPSGDGDGLVTALDALIVINFLNRTSAGAGEGEAVAPPAGAGTDAWPLSAGFDPSRTSTTPPACGPSRTSDAAAWASAPREIPVAIPVIAAPRTLAERSCSPASETDWGASETDWGASDARLTFTESLSKLFLRDHLLCTRTW
jgi:hypothetical protein